MPFMGVMDGQRVIPEEVADRTDVRCPTCDAIMRPRGPFNDGRARHFYHLSDSTTCAGGESDTHRKLKSLAVSALRTRFGEDAAEIGPEMPLDVSGTPTAPANRRVDALVWFQTPHEVFGEALAIEVQYRNTAKDIEATTHDYLSNGVSVYWADESDFQDDRFLIDHLLAAFTETHASPHAFSARTDTPPPVTGDGSMLTSPDSGDTPDGRWTPIDPVPGCRHEFITKSGPFRSGSRCLRCGLEIESRIFSEAEQAYIEPPMMTDLDTEMVADTRTVDTDYEPPEIVEDGEPPQTHYHYWGVGSEFWTHEKYHCMCGGELVIKDGTVFIDHGTSEKEDADCAHSWEVQGTTKVCTECGEERRPWDE